MLGRPQLAAIMVRKGYVPTIKAAFDQYLGQGAPAYADKERLTPGRAFDMIRGSGGLPVLAHASQLRTSNDAQLEQTVKDLVDLGLAGIEVFHSDHDDVWIARTDAMAEKYQLLRTGGSDFHGSNKKDIPLGIARGKRIPGELFDRLIEALAATPVR